MSVFKFAVIGFGHIGKRHAAMVTSKEECELVAIIDTDKIKREEARNIYGNIVFSGIDEYLKQKPEVDIICVCTPNGYHAVQTIKALDYGCHVICENPMALSKAECEEMIFKSLQASRHVFCVKQNRYTPTSKWLKEIIDKKLLGDIYVVQLNCYWNRDERYYKKGDWKGTKALDGGVLFTQFSHFVDIMYWLFGDIKNIQSRLNNFSHQKNTEFEDTGIVSFDFVNKGLGSINFSTSVYDQNLESSIAIIGEKGSVKVSGQYMDQVAYCHIKDYEMPQLPPPNPPNDYGGYKGSAANHHYVFDNVVDVLNGKSTISTNALEGLKVVEIIERIYTAGRAGQRSTQKDFSESVLNKLS